MDVAPFEPRMMFREEELAKEWRAYAWDNDGRPHTSALYSPWQLLYLDNVTDKLVARVGLDVLRAPAEQRDKVLGTWRGLLEAEESHMAGARQRMAVHGPRWSASGTLIISPPAVIQSDIRAPPQGTGIAITGVFNAHHARTALGCHRKPIMRLSANCRRPERRSDDSQTIFEGTR